MDVFRDLLFKNCSNYNNRQTERSKVELVTFLGFIKQFKLLHLYIAIFTGDLGLQEEMLEPWFLPTNTVEWQTKMSTVMGVENVQLPRNK